MTIDETIEEPAAAPPPGGSGVAEELGRNPNSGVAHANNCAKSGRRMALVTLSVVLAVMAAVIVWKAAAVTVPPKGLMGIFAFGVVASMWVGTSTGIATERALELPDLAAPWPRTPPAGGLRRRNRRRWLNVSDVGARCGRAQ